MNIEYKLFKIFYLLSTTAETFLSLGEVILATQLAQPVPPHNHKRFSTRFFLATDPTLTYRERHNLSTRASPRHFVDRILSKYKMRVVRKTNI